jgi:hypothetical protein
MNQADLIAAVAEHASLTRADAGKAGTVETLGVRQPRSGWRRVVSDPDQA